MALFFDKAWFDAALNARSLGRDDMARAAGISKDELTMMFKDQMEVPPKSVMAWANLLNVPSEMIALRCGISTKHIPPSSESARIDALERRVAVLEMMLKRLGVSDHS
jgi:hypothetical protein